MSVATIKGGHTLSFTAYPKAEWFSASFLETLKAQANQSNEAALRSHEEEFLHPFSDLHQVQSESTESMENG